MAERTRRQRVTQADVARRAGVSQAMVSYVLTGSAGVTVPEETRQRILAAMTALGYVPNRAARSLRTSKSFTIGCVIPDIANPFYPTFVRGIQDMVDPCGYDLVMYNSDGLAERENKAIHSLRQGRVDGVIGVFFHSGARALAALLEQQIAVVRLEAQARTVGNWPLDNLYVDSRTAAETAVAYLIGRGYERIALLTNAPGPGQPRALGYQTALLQHGRAVVEAYTSIGDFSLEGGAAGMEQLLTVTPPPDAVFAANDLMAIGAMMTCKAHGLRIPEEIAIVGFDDIPTAQIITPTLTTVSQFQRQLGVRAAELLLERLEGQAPPTGRNIEMPFQLILRQSA